MGGGGFRCITSLTLDQQLGVDRTTSIMGLPLLSPGLFSTSNSSLPSRAWSIFQDFSFVFSKLLDSDQHNNISRTLVNPIDSLLWYSDHHPSTGLNHKGFQSTRILTGIPTQQPPTTSSRLYPPIPTNLDHSRSLSTKTPPIISTPLSIQSLSSAALHMHSKPSFYHPRAQASSDSVLPLF